MKKIILTFLGLICFEQIASAQAQEEKILGYQPSDSGLSFHVTSGGCTKLEDFMIQLAPNKETGVTELRLVRTRPDTCYSFIPTGVVIQMTYEQMGLTANQAFEVKNQNGIVRGWIWKDTNLIPVPQH